MNLTDSVKPPFNFLSVIRSHGWYRLLPFVWNEDTRELQRTERLASGRVIVFTMRDAPNGIAVSVRERLNKAERQELLGKIAWMFSLDLDLSEFYDAVTHVPQLAHVRREAHGRFLRSPTIWEDVVKVLLTTNIQWGGTIRLVRLLVETFGEPYSTNAREIPNAFPIAERLARTRESRLRKLGLGYRAPYLLQLARGVASGKYELDALKETTRSTDELRKELLMLPGIGPYAAATLLMILGRYEFLAVDTEALRSVARGMYGGKPIGEKEVQSAFASWGKFKAIAYWFWDWDAK